MRLATASLPGVAICALALAARGDVPPPSGDCTNKQSGDACKDEAGRPGACGDIGYTRTWTPPTPGAAPQTSQSTYFGCKAGDTPARKRSGILGRCSVHAAGARTTAAPWAALLALVLGVRIASRRARLRHPRPGS